ncbi:hypothetical protein FI667_g4362, partial [Globisporangium splendens]
MDAKTGGRGAARNRNGNSTSNATSVSAGGKKRRSKARKKATGAAAAAATAPSSASVDGDGGGNGAKMAAAANTPHAPKSQTAVVAGNARKDAAPPAQQQLPQGQQGQLKKKKNRKRLHNGGKVAAANRAAGNESNSTSSNAMQGAKKMAGTGKHATPTGSHSNAAVAKPKPQAAAVLTRAAAAANASATVPAAKTTGIRGSIPRPEIKVKRKVDESTTPTAQAIPWGDKEAGKSSALKVATSSHADPVKPPPPKKLKVANTVAQVEKQNTHSLSLDGNVPAFKSSVSTPVSAPKPAIASPQQSIKPQSVIAAASTQAAVKQQAAPVVGAEPVEIESKPEPMEVDTEASEASAAQAEQTSVSFAAEPFVGEEPSSGNESRDVGVIEVEDSEPDTPKESSTSEALDMLSPAKTPTVDSFVDDSAIVSTNIISAEASSLHNATHLDKSAASTPSPLHESENELWPFSSPQQDPPASVHDDPAEAANVATDKVESVSPRETSEPENIVISESTHAGNAHEADTNLVSDGANPSSESVDLPSHEESTHEATISSSADDHEERKQEDNEAKEESESLINAQENMAESSVINPQDDGHRTVVSSSIQKIVIPSPVRTPPKSQWPPPRPANAWGASFGMTITPERTPATLMSASSPALATSPLSSWFLSKGQANFVQQVAFPPRASSERHHRRSVSPQRFVTKSHAQNSSSSLETALIANQEEDDDAQDGNNNAFLESLTQQASWRTWYGSVDQKDLLDPPLQRLPAEVHQALDATSSGDLAMETSGDQISLHETNEKTSIADLEDEIRVERDNASVFAHELMLMLQGKTLSGKLLEEEYRALLVHGGPHVQHE